MLTRSQTKDIALFDRNVQIIHGDIGYLREVNGEPLDALAFPTHAHLTNNGIGAAAAVHRRAGPQLNAFVRMLVQGGGRTAGEVVVTPAFNANVDKLIHCVGPRVSNPDCADLLQRTYESLMNAIALDGLKSVAVASISTGNMGVPATDGARTAMSAVQRFIRKHQWDGVIAFVCYDQAVFNAFVDEKRRVLDAFHTRSLP